MSIGRQGNIHGTNKELFSPGGQGRFEAFEAPSQISGTGYYKPGSVRRLPVQSTPPSNLYDHQSHIIPETIIEKALKPIVDGAFDYFAGSGGKKPAFDKLSLATLTTYLQNNWGKFNFPVVTEYINGALTAGPRPAHPAAFVDHSNLLDIKAVNRPEDRVRARNLFAEAVDGYFSVVNWNPVNLCRAPSDDKRRTPPGSNVDREVMAYIVKNDQHAAIKLDRDLYTFYDRLLGQPEKDLQAVNFNDQLIMEYIGVSNNLLRKKGILRNSAYYQFSWHDHRGNRKYVPGQLAR